MSTDMGTDMGKPEKIVLVVTTEWPGLDGQRTDKVELDPDQWDRLTPDERVYLCEKTAAEVFEDYCSYGFTVETS